MVAMRVSGLASLPVVVLVGVQHERPLPGANVVCERSAGDERPVDL